MLLVARLFGFLVRESRYRRWWHLLASSCGQRLYINPVILRAGPDCARVGRWALLLVVVTRSCAAGPDRWQCGRPAWTTTCGVILRSEGAQVSTCPADPATPVDDAAIPVGDGTTPASIASVNGRG